VDHTYQIGKYEVTNDQYVAFLNAVDPTGANALSLYYNGMKTDPRSGITQNSGNSNGAKYAVKDNMDRKPVGYVSVWDAARFCNWLQNGQGNGDTEQGAYANIGDYTTFARQPGAKYFIPTENEWVKAGYYDPTNTIANDNGYWRYPTRSDSAPTSATAGPTGDISNPGANVANYNDAASWNGQTGNLTTVGTAGTGSASYYGTYDQAGNVYECTETLLFTGTSYATCGGWYSTPSGNLKRDSAMGMPGWQGPDYGGFRVAAVSSTPEPGGIALAFTGIACLLGYGWQWRKR
jgi:formylglycine-generating enzyme